MLVPCETSTSTCLNLATISSGLYLFLAKSVLLDAKSHTSSRTTSTRADQQHEQKISAFAESRHANGQSPSSRSSTCGSGLCNRRSHGRRARGRRVRNSTYPTSNVDRARCPLWVISGAKGQRKFTNVRFGS